MNKRDVNKQDDDIRKLFSGVKIKAGENLKYRIMQQIETESVLTAKKSKSQNLIPLVGNTVLVFGLMYVLMILVAIGVYAMGGVEALNSLTFFVPVVMIFFICSMFWLISILDDKRRFKQIEKSRL